MRVELFTGDSKESKAGFARKTKEIQKYKELQIFSMWRKSEANTEVRFALLPHI